LVLLDYALPDSNGHGGLTRVRAAHEGTPVVILSGETRLQLVSDLVELGASGFISKASDTEVLLAALRIVMAVAFTCHANCWACRHRARLPVPMT
jgi:DNA-binding NarL/FixJ family response regulator